jgi:carboxypeptidase T
MRRGWCAVALAAGACLVMEDVAHAQTTLPTGRTTYRDLPGTNAELHALAAQYPDRVKLIKLSRQSLLGRDIEGIEIAHRVADDDGRPVFYVGGVLHSREWPSNDFAMEFANDLLMNDGTDPRITALLDKGRVTVVPMQNPDGYDVSRRNVNGNQQKRGNCRFAPGQIPTQAQCDAANSVNSGINNNRNFLPFWGGNGSSINPNNTNYRGEAPLSEPENLAYADYLATHNVTLGIDMHTPDRRLLSVQSSLNEPPVLADQATYVNLTNSIADKNLVGWPHGPWTNVYYEATSTEEEQTYYAYGAFGFTTEATPGYSGNNTYHPPYQAVIDNYWGIGQYPGATIRGTLLDMLEASQKPELHSRVTGTAPAGVTLTASKDFMLDTAPTQWVTGGPTNEIHSFPTHLRYSMKVPANGKFDWHLNPSLRPSQYTSEFVDESYTVTCTAPDGTVLQTTTIKVARGAEVNRSLCTQGGVGGTVPATLALTIGQAASFGAFVPGVGASYDATTAATVTSTAGDATLSVTDPSSNAPGHLVNGSFSLAQPITAAASKLGTPAGAFTAVPATLMGWSAPASNDAVTLLFRQAIGANEPLRTGTYSKTLTFTLSTTNP